MFALLVLAVGVLWYITNQIIKPKNYPPGPSWYPFFGCNNILQSRILKHGSQWKAISEMAKEYNTDVLGLRMAHKNVVVVFGEKNINQVSSDKEFEARPDSFTIRLRSLGKRKGITFVDGYLWREHRMFTMKHLRQLGFGKPTMDDDIQESVNIILSNIEESNGEPINIKMLVSMCTMNIIWKYIAGEHINDKKLLSFINLLSERTKVTTMAGGWLNQWSWLRYIAPEWSGYAPIKRMNDQMAKIINESIHKHLHCEIEGSDLMYFFLENVRKQKETYTMDQLQGICLDFLIAGAQTVGNTFDFSLIAALLHRDMQEKIYNEIDTCLGDTPPTLGDSERLVYTNAFLAETQRYFTIAPFSGPRRVLREVKIQNYTIPKGTTILVSLGDLHIDQRYWDEPQMFNPDRFIDVNGTLKTSTMVHPFGLGRRKCPGQPLAKAILFMLLVRIIQKFKIECVDDELPSAEPSIGFLTEARHFNVRFIKRD